MCVTLFWGHSVFTPLYFTYVWYIFRLTVANFSIQSLNIFYIKPGVCYFYGKVLQQLSASEPGPGDAREFIFR